MVTVDVVIPSYNHRRFLEQTISSVLDNADQVPLHLWIVDDCSTDGSADYLRSLNDDRITVAFNDTNMGACYTVNKAIEMGSAPFVANLNSDDLWHPNKLAQQLAAIEHAPDKVAFCLVDFIDDAGNLLPQGLNPAQKDIFQVMPDWDRYDWLRLLSIGGNKLCASTFLGRRAFLDKTGLFDVRFKLFLDVDMWARMFQFSDPVVLPEKLASFRLLRDGTNESASNAANVSRVAYEGLMLSRKFYRSVPDDVFRKMFVSIIDDPNKLAFDLKVETMVKTRKQQVQLVALDMLVENLETRREPSDLTHLDLHRLSGLYAQA